jgi:hypothetical protein
LVTAVLDHYLITFAWRTSFCQNGLRHRVGLFDGEQI